MYHVDNSTGVPVMPQPSPVTSETELFFTEGGNGVPPTFPGPDWFNIIQSELINILRAAGLDPDKMDNTQILAALKKLFLSRSNPFGDIKADGAAAIATALSNLGLKQLATLNGIENSFPFFDDSNTARLSGITTVGRTVVAAEKTADIVNYLGITELLNGKQPLDATLTAIAALAGSANKLPYFTGEDTVAITDLTAFARTILGRSDAAGVLSDLGLGPIATAADIQSGTAKKMVDASGLKSFLPKRNFAANDFVRIPDVPGGLIIQWGVVSKSIPEGAKNVIFPTPFPNFSLMAMATPSNLSGNAGIDVFSQVGAISNSDVNFFFSWVSTATPADGFRWFALGF